MPWCNVMVKNGLEENESQIDSSYDSSKGSLIFGKERKIINRVYRNLSIQDLLLNVMKMEIKKRNPIKF